jgi:glycosyltransferase involved in cell wall biosynthesis
MRIAVVNNFYPPRLGGSSHLSHALATQYRDRGHEVVVLSAAYGDEPEFAEYDGIPTYRLPALGMPAISAVRFDMTFANRPGLTRRLRSIFREHGTEVLHQHGQFFDLTWASGRAARDLDLPALLSIHTRLESPLPSYARTFRALDGLVVRPQLGHYRPQAVIMDKLMAAYVRDRYGQAVAGTVDIPVGVRVPEPMPEDPKLDFELLHEVVGLEHLPERYILSVGHVIPLRDRQDLVRALPHLEPRHADVPVVVVGGVFDHRYQHLAQELGQAGRVWSIGPQPRAVVMRLMRHASVIVQDLQGLGFGTASLEGLASGRPVMAAVSADNFPGHPLVSGEHCVLVPMADPTTTGRALSATIEMDLEERASMGKAGRVFVESAFTIEKVADAHEAALLHLLGRHASSSTPHVEGA